MGLWCIYVKRVCVKCALFWVVSCGNMNDLHLLGLCLRVCSDRKGIVYRYTFSARKCPTRVQGCVDLSCDNTHWPNTRCWRGDKSVPQSIAFSSSSLKHLVPMADSKGRVYLNDSKRVVRQKLGLQGTDKDENFFTFEVGPQIIPALFNWPRLMHFTGNLWKSLFVSIFLWSSEEMECFRTDRGCCPKYY